MLKNEAIKYADGIRTGKIKACKLVQKAVARFFSDIDKALDKGFTLKDKEGMRAIHFIEKLKQTQGEWAGQPLKLQPWQQFVVYNIFAWYKADGTRRFRYAYIDVARKNGKTTLSAAIGLYMLFGYKDSTGKKEPRAEVYSIATTKDQAAVCFDDAVAMVKSSSLYDPAERLEVGKKAIYYEKTGSSFKPTSSEDRQKDGFNPFCVLLDEYHAHRTNGMFDVMKSGMGARREPLMYIDTTAGFEKSWPCFAYRENCIKILNGIIEDDSIFIMIFTLDNADDWDKPELWCLANPNYGVSVKPDYLEEQVKDAKNRPAAVRNVKTKNFNCWVDAAKTWILDEKWMDCPQQTPVSELVGKPCWGGLDLANVSDITAFVLLFHENESYQLLPFFWIPKDTLLTKIKSGENAAYDQWVAQGLVTCTPGNITDYKYIEHQILQLSETYSIKSIAFDRWNSSQTIINLTQQGVKMTPFGQGYASMSTPTKEFEKIVLSRQLEHYNNAVMRWMMSNISMQTDPAGNIKPDKRQSSSKIDGVVASIEALGEYMTQCAKDDTGPYSVRGMRSL